MSINAKKTCCLRIGPRANGRCASIVTLNETLLQWSDELWYHGVHVLRCSRFKISLGCGLGTSFAIRKGRPPGLTPDTGELLAVRTRRRKPQTSVPGLSMPLAVSPRLPLGWLGLTQSVPVFWRLLAVRPPSRPGLPPSVPGHGRPRPGLLPFVIGLGRPIAVRPPSTGASAVRPRPLAVTPGRRPGRLPSFTRFDIRSSIRVSCNPRRRSQFWRFFGHFSSPSRCIVLVLAVRI